MNLWEAIGIKEPCILACTGAGGKTSVLLSLIKIANTLEVPVLLSTTTKMYYRSIMNLNPVFSNNYSEGRAQVALNLNQKGIVSWFTKIERDKVVGLPPPWLDCIMQNVENKPFIFVEADGARGLWMKSSNIHEPLVPSGTQITVGVLNLQAIGQSLTKQIVHRLELVLTLLQKQENEIIEWGDLAILALHKHGIFQYSQGRKILLLNGATSEKIKYARVIAEYLKKTKTELDRCIVTNGYGEALHPIEVYNL